MASLNSEMKIDAEKMMREMTVTVTIVENNRFRIKKWIAVRLVWLAAYILGCGVEFVPPGKT